MGDYVLVLYVHVAWLTLPVPDYQLSQQLSLTRCGHNAQRAPMEAVDLSHSSTLQPRT